MRNLSLGATHIVPQHILRQHWRRNAVNFAAKMRNSGKGNEKARGAEFRETDRRIVQKNMGVWIIWPLG
jgi:hypothetical protein